MEYGEPRSFLRVLWADFPLVNFCLYAILMAHGEVANLIPARRDLFFSCVFPLTIPLVIYSLRWWRAHRTERAVALAVLLGTALMLVLVYLNPARRPMENERLRNVYEVSAIANTLILVLHAWTRDRRMFAMFLGPVALYGLLLENGGIILGYFSELDYRWYLGPLPAPLATMSGWITVYYLVISVTWNLRDLVPAVRRSAALSALFATVAALMLDLQIDPLATAVGFWSWHEMLATGPMGVPLLNFVAWVVAVLPFAWAFFARQTNLGLTPAQACGVEHRRWLWPRVGLALGAAAVLFCSAMAIIEGGFDGPTYGILHGTLIESGILGPDLVWAPGG